MCPAVTKQPIPWEVCCGIAEVLAKAGEFEMALATVLTFALYLRASELLKLCADQVMPPIRGAGRAHRCWCVWSFILRRGARARRWAWPTKP